MVVGVKGGGGGTGGGGWGYETLPPFVSFRSLSPSVLCACVCFSFVCVFLFSFVVYLRIGSKVWLLAISDYVSLCLTVSLFACLSRSLPVFISSDNYVQTEAGL